MKIKVIAVAGLVLAAALLLLLEPVRTVIAPSNPTEEPINDELPGAAADPQSESEEPPTAPQSPEVSARPDGSVPVVSHQWPGIFSTLQALPDSESRNAAVATIINSVAESELPAALASLETQNGAAVSELRAGLARRWAGVDAPSAAAWAAQLTDSSQSAELLPHIAIAWANSDLAAAAEWAAALPESAGREPALLALAYEAARTDPITALKTASLLPATAERDSLVVHAFSQWAGTDAMAASTWAETVPDAALRERLLGTAAVAAAKQDGQVAATFTSEALAGGHEQDRAAVAVVQRWAEQAPEAAAAWAAQFPDSARQSAVEWLKSSGMPVKSSQ